MPILSYLNCLGGPLGVKKVILLSNNFFWSKLCGLLGKTPYIYARYQVWGVTDLSFDFPFPP